MVAVKRERTVDRKKAVLILCPTFPYVQDSALEYLHLVEVSYVGGTSDEQAVSM
jgi:hypothetical protein